MNRYNSFNDNATLTIILIFAFIFIGLIATKDDTPQTPNKYHIYYYIDGSAKAVKCTEIECKQSHVSTNYKN